MPAHNADIAAIFDEIADLLEIESENPFRIRAYRNAARTLRDLGSEVSSLLTNGEDLTELQGIWPRSGRQDPGDCRNRDNTSPR